MKLMFRHSWRPRPFTSFLGCMDLKTGVIVVLLFALFNKVAGIYGLIAIFTGGTLAQVSMYVYSVVTFLLFLWGLRAVNDENPKDTFYFSLFFACDHLLSTAWLGYFSLVWWVYTKHDGKQTPHSPAQLELIKGATGIPVYTDEEREKFALELWNKEKGLAAAVLIIGWILKIYFALLIWSYAALLRRGTYRSHIRHQYGRIPQSATQGAFDIPERPEDFELDEQEFHTATFTHSHTPGTATSFGELQRGSGNSPQPNGEVIFENSDMQTPRSAAMPRA